MNYKVILLSFILLFLILGTASANELNLTDSLATDNVKEIHLLNNNKEYIIALGGSELTSDSFINNLLGSITFDSI